MHLTDMFGEWDQAYRKTHPGQAHLAGSGPESKTCRECAHFTNEGRYSANSAKHPGNGLKPGYCRKYTALMKKKGPKFPHAARACRHFEQHLNPPVAVLGKKHWGGAQ